MIKKIPMLTGCLLALIFVTSCATTPLHSGSSKLVICVLPEPYERWEIAKVYLNGQYVDSAVPGNDRVTYDLAPGEYRIKVITDGYETCRESVSLIEGPKQQYVEFHPKKMLRRSVPAAIEKFFSN